MERTHIRPTASFSLPSIGAAFVLAALLFFPSGCATRGPVSPGEFGAPVYHTIAPGDTLWSLSKRYGTSLESIMDANRIRDPRMLSTGQRILIPVAGGRVERVKKEKPAKKGRWTHIVIHHSATAEGNAAIFDRDHRQRGFWNGLGYHFVICNGTSGMRDGEIQVGDRWVKQILGAHCNVGNMNEVGIGICLVGDFENGQRVSSRQFESLTELVRSLQKSYNIPDSNVIRHMDVKPTTECPGRNFPWRDLKSSLINVRGPSPFFLENTSSSSSRFRSSYRSDSDSDFYYT